MGRVDISERQTQYTRLNTYVTYRQLATIKNIGKEKGLGAAEIVRRALDVYFKATGQAAPKHDDIVRLLNRRRT